MRVDIKSKLSFVVRGIVGVSTDPVQVYEEGVQIGTAEVGHE